VTFQSQLTIHMLSVDEAATSGNVCRSTINNRIRAWDEAIKAGEAPPSGALESVRWGGRRLIRDIWLARALGLDPAPSAENPQNLEVSRCRKAP
jgi:hypothetical protein